MLTTRLPTRRLIPRDADLFGLIRATGTVVRQRAKGHEHNDALRRLANRLVGILHGCLKTGTLYDEATAWGHRENLPQTSAAA